MNILGNQDGKDLWSLSHVGGLGRRRITIICLFGSLSLLHSTTTAFSLPSTPTRIGLWSTRSVYRPGTTPAPRSTSQDAEILFGRPDDQQPLVAAFSDVDGTLVHYPRGDNDKILLETNQLEEENIIGKNNRILKLPASATGMRGVISSQALVKCQELRETGCKLVLVSGMRTSTLLTRLPFLPKADAYCCEGGGRIFYPVPLTKKEEDDVPCFVVHPEPYDGATAEDLQPFALKEDLVWRQKMEQMDAAGTDGFIGVELPSQTGHDKNDNDDDSTVEEETAVPVPDRFGALWDFAQELSTQGFVLDTSGYATCFRINRKQQTTTTKSKENFERLIAGDVSYPPGISTSTNLGCVDFYPEASGKRNCCDYLAQRFDRENLQDALSKYCVCLCDDDNDSEMALACEHAFIPGVGSTSMKEIIKKNPTHFSRTGEDHQTLAEGLVATERALELILERATDCGHRSIDGDECLLLIDDAHQGLKVY